VAWRLAHTHDAAVHNFWWIPFDPARNWPDLGPKFAAMERKAKVQALRAASPNGSKTSPLAKADPEADLFEEDQRDLGWATVLKRTFESYVRGERPNMVRSGQLAAIQG
jgi:WD repeat and SOF domain-containing protein 1